MSFLNKAGKVFLAPISSPKNNLKHFANNTSRDLHNAKEIIKEVKDINKEINDSNTIDLMVANNVHPRNLAKKSHAYQNVSYIFLMISLMIATFSGLQIFNGELDLMGTIGAVGYTVALLFMALVSQVKAYRLFKMEDTTLTDYLKSGDRQMLTYYKFTKSVLLNHFNKYGHKDYAKKYLNKKKKK